MSLPFSKIPATAKVTPSPFRVSIPKESLNELETLIKVSKIAPTTYENSLPQKQYGVTKDWLIAMREQWLRTYKWYILPLHLAQF